MADWQVEFGTDRYSMRGSSAPCKAASGYSVIILVVRKSAIAHVSRHSTPGLIGIINHAIKADPIRASVHTAYMEMMRLVDLSKRGPTAPGPRSRIRIPLRHCDSPRRRHAAAPQRCQSLHPPAACFEHGWPARQHRPAPALESTPS